MFLARLTRVQHSNGATQLFSIYYNSRYSLLPFYSTTTKPTQAAETASQKETRRLLEKFLINSLDFTTEEATSAAAKVKQPRARLKTIQRNPELVVTLLEQTGLDKTHIKTLVSTSPVLLTLDVDKILRPKIMFLQDLGLSGSDLVKVLLGNKSLLTRGLDTWVRPCLDYLRSILCSDADVVKALKKWSLLFSFDPQKVMAPNVLYLQKIGFSDEKLRKLLIQNPRFISQRPEWFEKVVHRLENDFGIPQKSPAFTRAFKLACSISKSMMEMKFAILREYGLSDEDAKEMFKKQPSWLGSSETKLRKVLDFLMKELGYTPHYIFTHPLLITLSLEKRIIPRTQVLDSLKETNLSEAKLRFYRAMCISEVKFLEDFVLPYKDEMPDLYESYMKSVRK